jgi:hypothetical protein
MGAKIMIVFSIVWYLLLEEATAQADWNYEEKAYLLIRECNKHTVKKKINDLQKVLMEGHNILSENEMVDFVSAFNYHVTKCRDDNTPPLQNIVCLEDSDARVKQLEEQIEESGEMPLEDEHIILREISFLRLVCGSVRAVSCSSIRELEALSLSAQMDDNTRESARSRWKEVKDYCKQRPE